MTALTNYIPIYQQILSVSFCKITPGSHCALPPPLPPLDQTTISSHLNYYCCLSIGLPNFTFISGAPNLQDLMPDDLQWSLCNNNRNNGHNKCNILNHSKTIPPPANLWKICLHKTRCWCQKGWGRLPYISLYLFF